MTSSPSGGERPSANCILDSSALLALILKEPGQERVQAAVDQGAILGAVNLTEVVTRLVDEGFSDDAIAAAIDGVELTVTDFQAHTAKQAGLLRRTTRSAGLSTGDRACLALAQEMNQPALTADRIWATLDLGIEVQLIRQANAEPL